MRTSVTRWTHTRLVALLAGGLLVGSVLGAGALGAAPAQADGNLSVSVDPGTVSLTVGGQPQNFTVKIRSDNGDSHQVVVGVSIPLTNYGVQPGGAPQGCVTQQADTLVCNVGDVPNGQESDLSFSLAPPGSSSIAAGQSQSGSGQVQAQAQGGGQSANGSYQATLTAAGPSTVGQVSGSVIDATSGAAVPNAQVTIKDGDGHSYPVHTDSGGNYSFAPSASQPLTPGDITVSFTATGYQPSSTTVQGQQGSPLAVGSIQLTKTAASPSPTPTAAATAAASPTAEATPKSPGLGAGTWLLIILGALLVAGGVVAIVFLLRRKDKDDGEDGDGGDGPFGPNGGGPGGYGNDAATTVLNRVPGDVSSDAPTMVHNGPLVPPDRDEFDDYDNFARSYGTSSFQNPGAPTQRYDQPTQRWNPNEETRRVDQPTGQWRPQQNESTQGWNPNQDQQATRASFNQPGDRYNEPTNGRGNQGNGYDQPTGRHGAADAEPPLWPDRLPNDSYSQQSSPYGTPSSPPANTYGTPSGPPASTYGTPSAPPRNTYGGGAPTSGPGYGGAPTSGGGYGGAPTSGNGFGGGYGGSPTSGGGYNSPASGGGYGNGRDYDAPTNGGGGYGRGGGESTQGWNRNQGGGESTQGWNRDQGYRQGGQGGGYSQGGQDYGQSEQSRHRVDDPTRQWNPNSGGGRPSSPPPASLDETRLERRDGVDWLDG